MILSCTMPEALLRGPPAARMPGSERRARRPRQPPARAGAAGPGRALPARQGMPMAGPGEIPPLPVPRQPCMAACGAPCCAGPAAAGAASGTVAG